MGDGIGLDNNFGWDGNETTISRAEPQWSFVMEGNKSKDKSEDLQKESGPIGLTLSKTPSFLEYIQMKLSQKIAPPNESIQDTDKHNTHNMLKASNIPATVLRVGFWERKSQNEGDIVAKFYFAKRKLVWEILECGLKKKIEIQWSDISAIKASFADGKRSILEVELKQNPQFFREVNPQPRRHTNWQPCSDFTRDQALTFRRHYLEFQGATLEKHYEKLLCSDNQLLKLSRKQYPSHHSPLFRVIVEGTRPYSYFVSHLTGIENQRTVSAPFRHSLMSHALAPSVNNNAYPNLKARLGIAHVNSPSSEFLSMKEHHASVINPRSSYLASDFLLTNGNSATNSFEQRLAQDWDQGIQNLRSANDIVEHQVQQLPSDAYMNLTSAVLPR